MRRSSRDAAAYLCSVEAALDCKRAKWLRRARARVFVARVRAVLDSVRVAAGGGRASCAAVPGQTPPLAQRAGGAGKRLRPGYTSALEAAPPSFRPAYSLRQQWVPLAKGEQIHRTWLRNRDVDWKAYEELTFIDKAIIRIRAITELRLYGTPLAYHAGLTWFENVYYRHSRDVLMARPHYVLPPRVRGLNYYVLRGYVQKAIHRQNRQALAYRWVHDSMKAALLHPPPSQRSVPERQPVPYDTLYYEPPPPDPSKPLRPAPRTHYLKQAFSRNAPADANRFAEQLPGRAGIHPTFTSLMRGARCQMHPKWRDLAGNRNREQDELCRSAEYRDIIHGNLAVAVHEHESAAYGLEVTPFGTFVSDARPFVKKKVIVGFRSHRDADKDQKIRVQARILLERFIKDYHWVGQLRGDPVPSKKMVLYEPRNIIECAEVTRLPPPTNVPWEVTKQMAVSQTSRPLPKRPLTKFDVLPAIDAEYFELEWQRDLRREGMPYPGQLSLGWHLEVREYFSLWQKIVWVFMRPVIYWQRLWRSLRSQDPPSFPSKPSWYRRVLRRLSRPPKYGKPTAGVSHQHDKRFMLRHPPLEDFQYPAGSDASIHSGRSAAEAPKQHLIGFGLAEPQPARRHPGMQPYYRMTLNRRGQAPYADDPLLAKRIFDPDGCRPAKPRVRLVKPSSIHQILPMTPDPPTLETRPCHLCPIAFYPELHALPVTPAYSRMPKSAPPMPPVAKATPKTAPPQSTYLQVPTVADAIAGVVEGFEPPTEPALPSEKKGNIYEVTPQQLVEYDGAQDAAAAAAKAPEETFRELLEKSGMLWKPEPPYRVSNVSNADLPSRRSSMLAAMLPGRRHSAHSGSRSPEQGSRRSSHLPWRHREEYDLRAAPGTTEDTRRMVVERLAAPSAPLPDERLRNSLRASMSSRPSVSHLDVVQESAPALSLEDTLRQGASTTAQVRDYGGQRRQVWKRHFCTDCRAHCVGHKPGDAMLWLVRRQPVGKPQNQRKDKTARRLLRWIREPGVDYRPHYKIHEEYYRRSDDSEPSDYSFGDSVSVRSSDSENSERGMMRPARGPYKRKRGKLTTAGLHVNEHELCQNLGGEPKMPDPDDKTSDGSFVPSATDRLIYRALDLLAPQPPDQLQRPKLEPEEDLKRSGPPSVLAAHEVMRIGRRKLRLKFYRDLRHFMPLDWKESAAIRQDNEAALEEARLEESAWLTPSKYQEPQILRFSRERRIEDHDQFLFRCATQMERMARAERILRESLMCEYTDRVLLENYSQELKLKRNAHGRVVLESMYPPGRYVLKPYTKRLGVPVFEDLTVPYYVPPTWWEVRHPKPEPDAKTKRRLARKQHEDWLARRRFAALLKAGREKALRVERELAEKLRLNDAGIDVPIDIAKIVTATRSVSSDLSSDDPHPLEDELVPKVQPPLPVYKARYSLSTTDAVIQSSHPVSADTVQDDLRTSDSQATVFVPPDTSTWIKSTPLKFEPPAIPDIVEAVRAAMRQTTTPSPAPPVLSPAMQAPAPREPGPAAEAVALAVASSSAELAGPIEEVDADAVDRFIFRPDAATESLETWELDSSLASEHTFGMPLVKLKPEPVTEDALMRRRHMDRLDRNGLVDRKVRERKGERVLLEEIRGVLYHSPWGVMRRAVKAELLKRRYREYATDISETTRELDRLEAKFGAFMDTEYAGAPLCAPIADSLALAEPSTPVEPEPPAKRRSESWTTDYWGMFEPQPRIIGQAPTITFEGEDNHVVYVPASFAARSRAPASDDVRKKGDVEPPAVCAAALDRLVWGERPPPGSLSFMEDPPLRSRPAPSSQFLLLLSDEGKEEAKGLSEFLSEPNRSTEQD